MSSSRLAVLTWSLIFGGMLSFALGWTIRGNDSALGWTLIAISGVAVTVGIILVWVRSHIVGDD